MQLNLFLALNCKAMVSIELPEPGMVEIKAFFRTNFEKL
jgi:hypothetical protein